MQAKRLSFFMVLSVFMFSLLFVGCGSDDLKYFSQKVSDQRMNYFQGETTDYFVSFSSGVRESPYVLDGKTGDKVDFGIILIKPKNSSQIENITYNVFINNEEFVGEFEKSPFDETYAGDINKKVLDDDIIVVKINNGSGEQEATLSSVSKDFKVDSQKALKIAIEELGENKPKLKEQNFEIYIKLFQDITNKIKDKYWIVTFLCEDSQSFNVLINPTTGECEQKKL
ncbi:MAG: hypothetical protein IJ837_04695 [Clostridia bacterium]|nr:hypothetical protein [Clostridia bacterium]